MSENVEARCTCLKSPTEQHGLQWPCSGPSGVVFWGGWHRPRHARPRALAASSLKSKRRRGGSRGIPAGALRAPATKRPLSNTGAGPVVLWCSFVHHRSVPIFLYARFHCKTLRGRVMRGLGYGSHIERGAVPSRLGYPLLFPKLGAPSALSNF